MFRKNPEGARAPVIARTDVRPHGRLRRLARRAALGFSVVSGAAIAAAGIAHAQSTDLKGIATGLTGQLGPVADILGIVAFVVGLAIGIGGILKFNAHSKNPQQVPLSQGMWGVGIGAALIALPILMGASINTIFGSGADTVSATGTLQSISTR